jgi:multimeric flavodoxin WrbA
MKIIGFNGSPRMNCGTAWAVNEILCGAAARGAATEMFYAGKLAISPCKGCLACVESDKCVTRA